MGDHDDGLSVFGVHPSKKVEHLFARFRVEVSGGLVAEKKLRVRGQCTGDRHPLLLSAGKLGGKMITPLAQADHLQRTFRVERSGPVVESGGHLHILESGESGDQIEKLKNEAHVGASEPGQLRVARFVERERFTLLIVVGDLSLGRPVHATDDIQKGTLSRTGLPEYHQQFSPIDLKIHLVESPHFQLAHRVDFRHIFQGQYRCHARLAFSPPVLQALEKDQGRPWPMKRFVLIDGSNMLFRAYYAIPAHLSTSSGQPTNAVFGFVTMLNKLLERKKPDYAAVIFDPAGGSFRNRESSDYKANRAQMPGDLASQLPLIDQVVEAFRIPVLRVTDFEADDVIATLAKQVEERGEQVLIVSSDKDFSQLLNDRVSMLDGMRDLTYTPELVKKKFGVSPEKFVDFQALCGDKIDNIPGVPGIGKKTASKLLDEYGDLETILDSTDKIGGSVAKKLEEHRDDALLSRKLARLDTSVEHGLDLGTFTFVPPDDDALNGLFRELEFFSLLKSTGDSQVAQSTKDGLTVLKPDQPLPDPLKSKSLAVVPVGTSIRHLFDTAGVAFLDIETGETTYLPIKSGDSLRVFFEGFTGQLVAHDVREFYRWCLHHGLKPPAEAFDTQTSSYLIDPAKGMPHDLAKLVKIHLHRVLKTEDDLLGKGKSRKSYSEVDANEIAEYGAHLARAIADLHSIFTDGLKEAGLVSLAADEVRLSLVLAGMERAGIVVNKPGLELLSEEFRNELSQLEQKIFAIAGHEFNIGSPKQLATVLFEEMGLPIIKRTKTGYSTNAEVLERLAQDHEIARLLLEYRKFEKLITTYVDVLLREVDEEDGRVHCQFNQTASTTGRLITSDPDLQRTPVRTDEGRRIRRLFRAPQGHQLLVADWSQVELRILAHLCGDPVLLDAFQKGADIHKRTASELFSKPEEEVTRVERDTAKTANFATIYGQGASALAQNLEIPKKEAEGIIKRYFEVYSGVREWIDRTMEEARVLGRVETLAGRTRFIPELFSKNFAVRQAGERMAVNTPVQGSAADICKRVMLQIDVEMKSRPHLKSRMLLQIHDELVFECPDQEVAEMRELVTKEMENAWELKVPLVVSVGVGPSWEEAKD